MISEEEVCVKHRIWRARNRYGEKTLCKEMAATAVIEALNEWNNLAFYCKRDFEEMI